MARLEFKLPDVGEGIAECEIAAWHVKPGDVVAEDQTLLDVLTDKAAVELPAPAAGRVLECRGAVGDKVAVGSVLVVLDTEASAEAPTLAPSEPAPAAKAQGEPVAAPLPATSPAAPLPARTGPVQTSPALRKRARELGVDLTQVPGTGPRGRITQADLQAYLDQRRAPPGPARADEPAVETVKLVGIRRKIAEAMALSARSIPHFSYVEEVDVTELEALRQHLNQRYGEKRGRLTLLPFLVRALVSLRAEFPQMNATFDEAAGLIHRHRASHIGIATQTPQGLMVPVLRHAERLDPWQAAAEIRRIAEAARTGKAKREELSGSTITLTSLGALGGIVTTPIINAPEVAIVGINRMVERPVIRQGQIVPRLMMNLSSSFDHRIVDGHDAALFIQALKARLEHPATLFLET